MQLHENDEKERHPIFRGIGMASTFVTFTQYFIYEIA